MHSVTGLESPSLLAFQPVNVPMKRVHASQNLR